MCSNVTIVTDEVVEDSETFLLSISSEDEAVRIEQPFEVSVIIVDETSEYGVERLITNLQLL